MRRSDESATSLQTSALFSFFLDSKPRYHAGSKHEYSTTRTGQSVARQTNHGWVKDVLVENTGGVLASAVVPICAPPGVGHRGVHY